MVRESNMKGTQIAKRQKIVILLAALPGIVGFIGIAHLFIRRTSRGLILLIAGWGIIGISVFCMIA